MIWMARVATGVMDDVGVKVNVADGVIVGRLVPVIVATLVAVEVGIKGVGVSGIIVTVGACRVARAFSVLIILSPELM